MVQEIYSLKSHVLYLVEDGTAQMAALGLHNVPVWRQKGATVVQANQKISLCHIVFFMGKAYVPKTARLI